MGVMLGNRYLLNGLLEKAIKEYKASLKSVPDKKVSCRLVAAYFLHGDIQDAMQLMQKNLEIFGAEALQEFESTCKTFLPNPKSAEASAFGKRLSDMLHELRIQATNAEEEKTIELSSKRRDDSSNHSIS